MTGNPNFDEIISRLAINPNSPGPWTCHCPCPNNHKDNDRKPSARLYIGHNGDLMFKCFKGCTTADVSNVLNIPMANWFKTPISKKLKENSHNYIEYKYTDAKGRYVYSVLRSKTEKVFFHKRNVIDDVGHVLGYTFSMGDGYYMPSANNPNRWDKLHTADIPPKAVYMPDYVKYPFRLHRWVGHQGTVFVVEGEKKVMAIEELGFYATCNSGGAMHWGAEHSQYLKDKRVIILPDNDEMGRRHAATVAGWLAMSGCKQFAIVDLKEYFTDLKEKGDIYDVIESHADRAVEFLTDLSTNWAKVEYVARTKK